MTRPHVVQVGCVHNLRRLSPAAHIADWPSLAAVASAVADAGARVTVMQASYRNERHHHKGVDFEFVAEASLGVGNWAGLQPLKLAGRVANLNPDIIHVHGLTFPFHIRALCRLGVPVLAQDHATGQHPRLSILYRYGLGRVAGVSFTALEQAGPLRSCGMLPAAIPIYSVVEGSTAFVPGDRNAARLATGMAGSPALLWVGRLDENKDPLTILEAVSHAARELSALRLWFVFHDAPLLDAVRARIAGDPWLAPRVHLLGKQTPEQVELLCRAADIFVLGSGREGSGYALLEAMACGLPAVVSDIPSFRKITGDGRFGRLVPRGNAAAFASAITKMWAAMPSREAVRRHFENELSYRAIGRQLLSAYGQLIAGAA